MPDNIKYAVRAPRDTSSEQYTVPLVFVDIPKPDAGLGVSIIDIAGGTLEDSVSRGVIFPFTGVPQGTTVYRDSPSRGYGWFPDPATGSAYSFTLPTTNSPTYPFTYQESGTLPVKILSVEEDACGAWHPVVSRGLFFRLYQLTSAEIYNGSYSWLAYAGFQVGQYVLLAYTTELDWRLNSFGGVWRGASYSGGGGQWKVRNFISAADNNQQVKITPGGQSGAQNSTIITSIGGLVSSTGIELLTEAPQYTSSVLQPPGTGGTIDNLFISNYQASFSDPTVGRLRSAVPASSGSIIAMSNVAVSTLTSGIRYDTLWGDVTPIPAPSDPTTVDYTMTGAFFAPVEGFYFFGFAYAGKIRLYHWNIPVIDKWYGQTPGTVNLKSAQYIVYMHMGWHDMSIEWAPENLSNSTVGTIKLTVTPPAGGSGWHFASSVTTRSQVASLNTNDGTVVFKNSFVGGINPLSLYASYASTSSSLSFHGYFDNVTGVYHSLDLNPSFGRRYDQGTSPTSDWVENTCWLYMLPTLACAVTQSDGVTPITTAPNWISSVTWVKGSLRWGSVSAANNVAPWTSLGTPFGSASAFGSEVLGITPFSNMGASQGLVNGGTINDPRGAYQSAFILGHLNVSNGLPTLSSVRLYDIRQRGGGLPFDTDPSTFPTGGARERVETYWDVSSWEGVETSTYGTVLVEIPTSILTGSDGGPVWTANEIQQLVSSSVAAGIQPIITYI